jgi:hypothetical protein
MTLYFTFRMGLNPESQKETNQNTPNLLSMSSFDLFNFLQKSHLSHDTIAGLLCAYGRVVQIVEGSIKGPDLVTNNPNAQLIARDDLVFQTLTDSHPNLKGRASMLSTRSLAQNSVDVIVDPHVTTILHPNSDETKQGIYDTETITEKADERLFYNYLINLRVNARALSEEGLMFSSVSFGGPTYDTVPDKYPPMAQFRKEVVLTWEQIKKVYEESELEILAVSPGAIRSKTFDVESGIKVLLARLKNLVAGNTPRQKDARLSLEQVRSAHDILDVQGEKASGKKIGGVEFNLYPWVKPEDIDSVYQEVDELDGVFPELIEQFIHGDEQAALKLEIAVQRINKEKQQKLNRILSHFSRKSENILPFLNPDRLVIIARKRPVQTAPLPPAT